MDNLNQNDESYPDHVKPSQNVTKRPYNLSKDTRESYCNSEFDKSDAPKKSSSIRVGIIGSRNYANMTEVGEYIKNLPRGAVVVTGGHPFGGTGAASGVDLAAATMAWATGRDCVFVPANWNSHGKAAGFRRNPIIVQCCDKVVAFWDGKSRGTADTLKIARSMGIPTEVVYSSASLSEDK